ncbi:nuclear speckle splicing regulatory protein 1 [Ceratobasidium sp. AG-Ba]|nr:nuclear speckle splicing regulatory protein 1 [Ceratobasidium sp. AG-Ba]QRW14392.1 nuclear speckle splicing regulatory protein 1 [Ceratobasidium sp. AG-Ba]
MATKLSFSLGKPKPKEPVGTAPPLAKSAFGDDSEPVASTSTAAAGPSRRKNDMTNMAAAAVSRKAQRKMDAELKVDNTVYQYDEVWDGMKLAEAKAKAQKEDNPENRQAKYMKKLLDAAATRRLDHLRAEEKLMQREREAEGDEFAGKEKFVTQAYKDQMAEVRRAEAEEKAREEAERQKNKGLGGGMTHFYKQLLDDAARSHDAAVAASASTTDPPPESTTTTAPGKIGPAGPNLTITRPPRNAPRPLEVAPSPADVLQPKPEGQTRTVITDGGAEVEVNDNNEIVDKRELLSAGLNLALPNTRNLALLKAIHGSSKNEPVEQHQPQHRAAGVAASRQEIRQRQQKALESQLEEERRRVIEEKERQEREERERIVKRRNDDEAVMSAKERYLERKRRKMEEAKAEEADKPVS